MEQQKQEITLAVAERIKFYRRLRSYSQESLALQAGLNPAYFGQVERGLKCPTIDTLYKIARALDISLSELLRIDTTPLTVEANNHYRQQIQEILSRIPSDKLDQFIDVMERIALIL